MDALNSYPICSLIASTTFWLVSIGKPFVDHFVLRRCCLASMTHRGLLLEQESQKPKSPPSKLSGLFVLATSYSRTTYRRTTIGAAAFHFRVRNGNGWCHCAIITRTEPRMLSGLDSGDVASAVSADLVRW